MTNVVFGPVRVQGTDDEWFVSDEHVDQTFNVRQVLEPGASVQYWTDLEVKWGGECRVELDLSLQQVGNNQVQCSGAARFFEGTSEETTDLEDVQDFSFTLAGYPVGTGDNPAHTINLYNNELAGGDSATITLDLDNWYW